MQNLSSQQENRFNDMNAMFDIIKQDMAKKQNLESSRLNQGKSKNNYTKMK
jgi:hypothetical protein